MEVRGDDPFRIRSYRRAAEAIEALPQQISEIVSDEKKLLEIPGIGKGMAANLREIAERRQAAPAFRAADPIPTEHAGAVEDPGTRSQDDRAYLGRVPSV